MFLCWCVKKKVKKNIDKKCLINNGIYFENIKIKLFY